jgi:hypothetical protein
MYVLGVIIMYVYYDLAWSLYQDGDLSALMRMLRRMRGRIKLILLCYKRVPRIITMIIHNIYVLLFSMSVKTVWELNILFIWDVTCRCCLLTRHDTARLSISRLTNNTSGSHRFSSNNSFVIIVVTVTVVKYNEPCVSTMHIYFRDVLSFRYIDSSSVAYIISTVLNMKLVTLTVSCNALPLQQVF